MLNVYTTLLQIYSGQYYVPNVMRMDNGVYGIITKTFWCVFRFTV